MIRAASLAALFLAPLAPAQAEMSIDGPVVVELFTSQGCAACPPADRLLGLLGQHEDVIALALHVDYWDYIGWRDRFADPAHTERQKAYARSRGERMVYTPQMVIGGETSVVGTRPEEVLAALEAASAPNIALRASRHGDRIAIQAPAHALGEPVTVHLVRTDLMAEQRITSGENAGHTFEYHNIVTAWDVLGTWDGTAPLSIEAAAMGDAPCVVILQRPGPGEILAAIRVE